MQRQVSLVQICLFISGALLVDGSVRGTEPAPDAAAIQVAREKARLVHDIYAATLDVMHHHYFRPERAVLPARAMEDVFADVAREAKVQARWIAVNTRPMSVNHEPQTDFEKSAAKAISGGKSEVEQVVGQVYSRVGAIPLGSSCVGCHTGGFAQVNPSARFAGLVISVPLASASAKVDSPAAAP